MNNIKISTQREHRLSKYFVMKKKKFAVAELKYGQGMKIN